MSEIYKPVALVNRAPIYIYEGSYSQHLRVDPKDRIGGRPWTDMELAKRVISLIEREQAENIKESNANLRQKKAQSELSLIKKESENSKMKSTFNKLSIYEADLTETDGDHTPLDEVK